MTRRAHRGGVATSQRSWGEEWEPTINGTGFDAVVDGGRVALLEIGDRCGIRAAITNFGGRVVALMAPDRQGAIADVALGYETLEGYLANPEHYLGALIGRYANRIENSQFELKGVSYELDPNEGRHCLHGGSPGFHGRVWNIVDHGKHSLVLSRVSADGEGGFPGILEVQAKYAIEEEAALVIELTAVSDKTTVVNLSSHMYFNLAGVHAGPINDHRLELRASRFTPVDEQLIPTGELRSVRGTPMDFRSARRIGAAMLQDDEQIRFGSGFDHNFAVDSHDAGTLNAVAMVTEPKTGRTMQLFSNQPGVHFYTGNHLDDAGIGKQGIAMERHHGFCLEAQNFPAAPNRTGFPNCVLNPGELYHSRIVYRFGVTGGRRP